MYQEDCLTKSSKICSFISLYNVYAAKYRSTLFQRNEVKTVCTPWIFFLLVYRDTASGTGSRIYCTCNWFAHWSTVQVCELSCSVHCTVYKGCTFSLNVSCSQVLVPFEVELMVSFITKYRLDAHNSDI